MLGASHLDALGPLAGRLVQVGLSRKEMAERIGRSESAVRTLLTRATIKLLAALEERV